MKVASMISLFERIFVQSLERLSLVNAALRHHQGRAQASKQNMASKGVMMMLLMMAMMIGLDDYSNTSLAASLLPSALKLEMENLPM